MSALFILIIASLSIAVLFLGAFLWSVKDNQLNDHKGNALRILQDNDQNISSKN